MSLRLQILLGLLQLGLGDLQGGVAFFKGRLFLAGVQPDQDIPFFHVDPFRNEVDDGQIFLRADRHRFQSPEFAQLSNLTGELALLDLEEGSGLHVQRRRGVPVEGRP